MSFRLETPRLALRPFEPRDIEPFSEYRSDPQVAQYQGWQVPYTLEQAAQFVDEMRSRVPGADGQWYQLAIELKTTGRLIGDCAFYRLGENLAQAEIGFTLARPFQGQGYASEAVTRLLAYLFDELGLHRVKANTDPANLASIRLLNKVGMRYEGRFIESLWLKGEWVSEDWFAMLRREWEARRA